jgi:hypothetical protein
MPSADVLRTAALLDLSSPGGFVVLAGSWAADAIALGELTEVRALVVNPAVTLGENEWTSVLETRDRLPLAAASARGIALDAGTIADAFVDSAIQALRSGGRLVAPLALQVPSDVRELARDSGVWVGVRETAASRPVALGSSRRR